VEAPHDQKPGWWIARELAIKLGLGEFYPWQDIKEYLSYRLEKGGYSLEQLERTGIIRGPKQPTTFEEGVKPVFDTPTGKIEFWSTALQKYSEAHGNPKGFEPVPVYTPPDQPPPGSYRLLFGRAPTHSFSRTQTNPLLHDVMPENELWLNMNEAKRLGVKSGDRVRVKNVDGALSDPILVKATQRIRPDCVYMVHGFGHTSKGLKRAYRKGASDAQLLTRYKVDPLMGGTGLNMNFVTVVVDA
jgi:thiosulfate reductase/polysulfide reductase chain A